MVCLCAAAFHVQLQHVPSLQQGRAGSPCGSPMYGRMSSALATPFNRRVAVVYDTTASGRFLLKWATDMVLEPADNVFVVRAVPKAAQKVCLHLQASLHSSVMSHGVLCLRPTQPAVCYSAGLGLIGRLLVLCVLRGCCLQARPATTSFADKHSVQRLAADALPNQPHVTAFNVQVC